MIFISCLQDTWVIIITETVHKLNYIVTRMYRLADCGEFPIVQTCSSCLGDLLKANQ